MNLFTVFLRSSKLLGPASVVVVAGLCVPTTAFASPESVRVLGAGAHPKPNIHPKGTTAPSHSDCQPTTMILGFELEKDLSGFAPENPNPVDNKPKQKLKLDKFAKEEEVFGKDGKAVKGEDGNPVTAHANPGTWKYWVCP